MTPSEPSRAPLEDASQEPERARGSKPAKKRYKPMRSISSFFRKGGPEPKPKSKKAKAKKAVPMDAEEASAVSEQEEDKSSSDADQVEASDAASDAKSEVTPSVEESEVSAPTRVAGRKRRRAAVVADSDDEMGEDEEDEECPPTSAPPAKREAGDAKAADAKATDAKAAGAKAADDKATDAKAAPSAFKKMMMMGSADEPLPAADDDSEFHPIRSAMWKKGAKSIPFRSLSRMFERVEATTKRLVIIRLVADYFRSVITLSPEKLTKAFYLCCNKIAPEYSGLELGIGDSILIKALSEATGSPVKQLRAALGKVGDLGEVAHKKRSKQRTMFPAPPLTLAGVFDTFVKIAKTSGKNSGSVKKNMIKRMLVASKEHEPKFIFRALQGNLRIGLASQSVQAALARAVVFTPPGSGKADATRKMSDEAIDAALKRASAIIKQAFIEVPNPDHVIKMLLQHGLDNLAAHCQLTPGIPIKAMLGKPATGISVVLEKFAGVLFTVEFKYDGERAQIHLMPDGTIKIFSRNSEDNTGKYPDLIASLPDCYGSDVESFIIDCEVVAWDRKAKKILPFQSLSHRKRKAVNAEEIDVQVVLFAFDCIYMNGKSLINEQFIDRRRILREKFNEVDGKLFFARGKDAKEVSEIQDFLKLSVESSCEGLMVKALNGDAKYVPDKRNWIKIKKDYLDGMSDSLDLVPIGAFRGKGKRTGLFGCFLLACYDPETEEFQSITKIGTGFSEADLKQHTAFFKEHTIEGPKSYYRYDKSLECDVWFEPCQVWEVRAADLSISPVHKAAIGQVHPSKGIALRFPRFLRIRDDKDPESSTLADQVVEFYRAQSVISG